MPLTPQERNNTSLAIGQFLSDHIDRPFEILRERGVVAELRSRLVNGLGLQAPQPVPLFLKVDGPDPYEALADPPLVNTSRVQLEFVATTALLLEQDRPAILVKKHLDVVVFSGAARLIQYSRGHGDVVQQVAPTALSAAIEVKTAPSSDMAGRGDFLKDISALLWLAAGYQVSAYFVLLDKSQGLYLKEHYGEQDPRVSGCDNWWNEITLIYRKRDHQPRIVIETSAEALGIHFSDVEPEFEPHVELWFPWHTQPNGPWEARCTYAHLDPAHANLHVNRNLALANLVPK